MCIDILEIQLLMAFQKYNMSWHFENKRFVVFPMHIFAVWLPRLMVFPLLKTAFAHTRHIQGGSKFPPLKTLHGGSKYLKFQGLKSLSVSKDYATSENSL